MNGSAQGRAGATRDEIEAILFEEADLLDTGDLTAWLALFTDDATYRIPGDDGAAGPEPCVAILDDDRALLEDRVWRLQSGSAHAQIPPSRTCRFVSNIRVAPCEDDAIVVHSRLMIAEVRRSERRTLAGRVEHRLRRVGDTLKIARKTVFLLDAQVAQRNLTFVI